VELHNQTSKIKKSDAVNLSQALTFDYTSASLTSRNQNADGTYGAPQTVTIAGSGTTASVGAAVAPGSTNRAYLQISGVVGGNLSSNPAINGAFALGGYSLGGQSTGANGQTIYDPLSVTVLGGEATPALNTLLADVANGTILSSVTLLITDAAINVVYKVTLNGATIVNAQQAGQQAALAFDYHSITITPFNQLPDGTYQQGTVVTTTTAGGSFADAAMPALSDTLTNGNQTLQLNVAGDTGPSLVTGFTGDFAASGYSLSLAGGTPGPLIVNLAAAGNDLGVSNLYADMINGTVIPTVTLSQVVTIKGSSTVIEQITLTNATVTDYTDPGGSVTVTFDYTSASLTSRPQNPDGTYGVPQTVTFDNPPCYCSGTRILTAGGQVAVEDLKAGDRVLTLRNGEAEIIWVGSRTIDVARHAMPEKVFPVRILAGAFADGLPARDLRLSPDHALFIDGYLIEAKTLVNGVTVVRETATRSVTYHHIELASHDIVLAEGLPAESYLESGNRMMFESHAAPVTLHPDFAAVSRLKACAPLLTDGTAVLAARRGLLERAAALGFAVTDAIDLTATVAGETIAPVLAGSAFLFLLPSNATSVDLISAVGVPAETSAAPGDRRMLGVAVTSMALISGRKRIIISLQNPAHTGFHEMEDGHRWTNGAARIALPKYSGRAMLEVTINGQASRWAKAA
jgi:hypothetical protein